MKDKGNWLVIIAARGGSKGIKGKNIRDLCGKPLIAHSILQAKKWGKAAKIVCTTDSDEIASIAKEYGAEVPFRRPARISGDDAGKIDVLRHALTESEKYYKTKFDAVLDLDVTAPIRTVRDINNIIGIYRKKVPDCVFSVVKSRKNPYFNMVERQKDGTVAVCKKPLKKIRRRQDTPVVYDMNTSMYVYKRDFLLDTKNKMPYSKKTYVYEMPDVSAIDIDSEMDFRFIEFLVTKGLVKL